MYLGSDQYQAPQSYGCRGPAVTTTGPYRVRGEDKSGKDPERREWYADNAARDYDEDLDGKRRCVEGAAQAAECAAHRPLARR